MKIISNFELWLCLNCNQIDIKVVISIKYGWNNIVWTKIRHLKHFVQYLLGAKAHTICKILKLCQHFMATKTHMDKIFGIWIFLIWHDKVKGITMKKNQVGPTSSSWLPEIFKQFWATKMVKLQSDRCERGCFHKIWLEYYCLDENHASGTLN